MANKPRRARAARPRPQELQGLDIARKRVDRNELPIDEVAILGDQAADTLRALIEAMGDGVALVTRDGVICYHNSRFAELVQGSEPEAALPGSGAVQLRGLALRDLVGPDAAVAIAGMFERAQRGPSRIEVGLASPSGGTLPVQQAPRASAPAGHGSSSTAGNFPSARPPTRTAR